MDMDTGYRPDQTNLPLLTVVGYEPAPVAPDDFQSDRERVMPFDYLPAIERHLRNTTEPRLLPDLERFHTSLQTLETALSVFDDPSLDTLNIPERAQALRTLDPENRFIEAFGRHTACTLTLFRDLFPTGTQQQLSFTDVVLAKLVKLYTKYGDVPQIAREMGITTEEAFQEARRRYVEQGGRISQDAAARAAIHVGTEMSVKGLARDTGRFKAVTQRPFSGSVAQMNGEIEEVREKTEKLPLGELIRRLQERRMQRHSWRRPIQSMSITDIIDAEDTDPFIGVAGESVDIFLAGLDVLHAMGPHMEGTIGSTIIRQIFAVKREDSGRMGAPADEDVSLANQHDTRPSS